MADNNPEEGRITPEEKEVLLRDARRKTVRMKRQYRQMRTDEDNKQRAERWLKNHQKVHQVIEEDMATVSGPQGPQNRRVRRQYARKLNVFKRSTGWSQFNEDYKKRYGYQQSISRKLSKQFTEGQSKKTKQNIASVMAEGDKE